MPIKRQRPSSAPGGGHAVPVGTFHSSCFWCFYKRFRLQSSKHSPALYTPPGCRETLIFDISEIECDPGDRDLGEFSLPSVMVIQALPQHFEMDATDCDKDWDVWSPSALDTDLTPETGSEAQVVAANVNVIESGAGFQPMVDVVVDSGADVSVAPLSYRHCGEAAGRTGVLMQDAQGKRIQEEIGSRILNVEVKDADGRPVQLRERFSIANIGSVTLSLGRLIRGGWNLSHGNFGQCLVKDGCSIPIRLRRNTLVMAAIVSAIAMYDSGPLPPEAEEVAAQAGWRIMPSGLPLRVVHRATAVPLEDSLWSTDDWSWVSVFVRKEVSERQPQPGDVWLQVLTMSSQDFERHRRQLILIDPELQGERDICILFHVEEIPSGVLSDPGELFSAPCERDPPFYPAGEEPGAGVMVDDVQCAVRKGSPFLSCRRGARRRGHGG